MATKQKITFLKARKDNPSQYINGGGNNNNWVIQAFHHWSRHTGCKLFSGLKPLKRVKEKRTIP